ncbi:MAG TPA: class I SAM-dependent methyltransferase [Solirubrobacteraceae bacterium]|nr:class I SAM-dependent methyltransferase [Solirubrobacteraceae bacterium]
MAALPPTPDPTRFHEARPGDLRTAPRWHRLAHIVNELPRVLERLSAELGVPATGRVLDFGCAEAPYRRFFPDAVEYLAADLQGNPHANLTLAPDGTLPLESESVHAVLSTQVLEHVADPSLYLEECARVLRPGGRLLLSTHGFMVYHPDPVDYWRWTCAGLRRALEQAGLGVVHFEGVMGPGASGLQLVHDAVYFRLPRPLQPLWAFALQSLIALADRLESRASKDMNALVFALIAEKR